MNELAVIIYIALIGSALLYVYIKYQESTQKKRERDDGK